ncbi:hypothetical protein IG193_07585 [Infirmifilum lucidum]|uniref:Uncharacterized protein n=1 Tax=Infirmifilum lucidum TaxID=2776706 RepID=A0A7L9FFP3_9CREN|nr:hypothetical protein [Infirmifilum lucidum]QOJ78610.1 hypothetical protein IG193_07585 [Infirmifilum lucidum]
MQPWIWREADSGASILASLTSDILRKYTPTLLEESGKLPLPLLAERIYELLRKHDVNIEVSTQPLPVAPYLLLQRDPLRLVLVLHKAAYQVWPELKPVSLPGVRTNTNISSP